MATGVDALGGGQFGPAIKAIIEAERQPIKTLENRKGVEDTKLKLFQEFKGKFSAITKAIDGISSFNKLRELKVDLAGAENQLGVTVDKERAQPGTYEIKIEELAKRSSMITRGFSSPDEKQLGLGYVVIPNPDGDDIEIFVDEDNGSLSGIAKLINDNHQSPVRASILQDMSDPDRPWRLSVAAKKEGEANHIQFPEFYFMSGDEDIWIEDSKDAKNAYVEINGFAIESPQNKIENFLTGVNVQLKQADPEKMITLTISEDPKQVAGKMKAVVDQVNGVLEFVNKQNAVDKESDTRSMFTGDTSLQTVEWRLRNLMHEGFPVQSKDEDGEYSYIFMHELGVEFGKDGKLTFNEEKFQKAVDGNFDRISEALTSEWGFARQLKDVFANYTRPGDGLLASKEAAIKSRIRSIDQNIEMKEKNLERKTQQVKDKFSRLQASLNQMQNQSAFLASSLGNGGGAGGNIISQLLG